MECFYKFNFKFQNLYRNSFLEKNMNYNFSARKTRCERNTISTDLDILIKSLN